jgi:hypothetical protein
VGRGYLDESWTRRQRPKGQRTINKRQLTSDINLRCCRWIEIGNDILGTEYHEDALGNRVAMERPSGFVVGYRCGYHLWLSVNFVTCSLSSKLRAASCGKSVLRRRCSLA